jgi:TPR repeat protein
MTRYKCLTRHAARLAMVALVSIPVWTPAAEPPPQAAAQNYRALCTNDLVPGSVDLAMGQSAESAKDYATAMFCYLKSNQKGEKAAASFIGFLYETGLGTPRDHNKALSWFDRALNSGGMAPRVEFKLGMALLHGEGLPQNSEKASYWLKQAAQEGDKDAQAMLPRLPMLSASARQQAKDRCYQECSEHEMQMRVNMPDHLGYTGTRNYLNDLGSNQALCEEDCDKIK